jgi:type IV secretion system protein VirD4
MAVAIILSVWRAKEAQNVTTYGSARWADIKEVRRAGLLGPDGVVLGRLGGSYLRHDGPEHVLCFAPTRSGKGVGLVIPTPYGQKIETAQRRQRSNIFGLGPVLHNKLAVDA